ERDRVIREKEAYESRLLAMIDKFKRMAFAQKRERFEGNKDQLALPFESAPEAVREQQQAFEQKIEYIRKKKPSAHKGRAPLPDHLPVEEVEIHPEGDLAGMACIGKEVTEELDYIPGKYIIRRYIRFKYAPKAKNSEAGVLIGELPGSAIGKAVRYSADRWDELSNYLYDGNLCIDNNGVENGIRPVALGRKNYLFAGSHQAAQRAAMVYSFFAICKKHEVNPYEWLKYTLQNIMAINHKNIRDLYPQNFKNNM